MHWTQNNILPVLTIMAVVAILLSFYVVSSIINFRRVKALRLQSASNLIQHEERLKKAIAAELHDELSSSLAAIRLHLQDIILPEGEKMEQLDKVQEQIKALSPRIKNISFNLVPVHLAKFGLAPIVRDLIDNSGATELQTSISISRIQLPADVSLQLFRIIQETFTNTLKHAKAAVFHIRIQKEGKDLIIEISDNGIGFDKNTIRKVSKGIGLSNIKSRVEILKGKMQIVTAPNEGVRYFIKIPANGFAKNKNNNRR